MSDRFFRVPPRVDESPPVLAWDRVLSVPVIGFLATWDGTRGAGYEDLGLVLLNGETLNLTRPCQPFYCTSTTIHASFLHDLTQEPVAQEDLAERCLKNLIYCDCEESGRRQFFAVMEDGSYVTSYAAFNYTEFACASFRMWQPGLMSRLYWGRLDLTQKRFFNAWTHDRIDPFAVYR